MLMVGVKQLVFLSLCHWLKFCVKLMTSYRMKNSYFRISPALGLVLQSVYSREIFVWSICVLCGPLLPNPGPGNSVDWHSTQWLSDSQRRKLLLSTELQYTLPIFLIPNVLQTIEIPFLKVTKKVKSMQMFHKPIQTAIQV